MSAHCRLGVASPSDFLKGPGPPLAAAIDAPSEKYFTAIRACLTRRPVVAGCRAITVTLLGIDIEINVIECETLGTSFRVRLALSE
jgi:hypothetical protein